MAIVDGLRVPPRWRKVIVSGEPGLPKPLVQVLLPTSGEVRENLLQECGVSRERRKSRDTIVVLLKEPRTEGAMKDLFFRIEHGVSYVIRVRMDQPMGSIGCPS